MSQCSLMIMEVISTNEVHDKLVSIIGNRNAFVFCTPDKRKATVLRLTPGTHYCNHITNVILTGSI